MRALGPLVVAGALLAPCDSGAQPGGPLEAAVKFFEASLAHRCSEVWGLYSAGTQENIRAEVHRREREREGAPEAEKPESRYCSMYGTLKHGSARIVRSQGDEAVVAVDLNVKYSTSRYDLFPKSVLKTEELRLVREAGAWRVQRPRMDIARRGLTEIGPVDVFYEPSGNLGRDRLEATTVTRAPRGPLVAALQDPMSWGRWLPSVKAVQVLERSGDRERVRLTFAATERSITVTLQPTEPRDPNAYESAAIWEVEGGSKAPVYFRGSWRVRPYSDGTRVTLLLSFDRRQWPGDPLDDIFSRERMAAAVLGLGK